MLSVEIIRFEVTFDATLHLEKACENHSQTHLRAKLPIDRIQHLNWEDEPNPTFTLPMTDRYIEQRIYWP